MCVSVGVVISIWKTVCVDICGYVDKCMCLQVCLNISVSTSVCRYNCIWV